MVLAQLLHNFPILNAGEPFVIEVQNWPERNHKKDRVLHGRRRVVQYACRLIAVIARVQHAISHLELSGDHKQMCPRKMLMRLQCVTRLPKLKRRS